jgi:hypothetical protein
MLGLTTLLQRINGNAADPLTLAAQLAEIESAIDALPGREADLAERRLAALRRDDDAQARKIEAQQADLKRDRDRLVDSKRNFAEQLRTARAAEEARAAEAIVAAYLSQSEDLAAKLEAADVSAMQQRLTWDRNERVLAGLGIEPLGCMLILGNGFGVQWSLRTRQAIAAMREQRSGVLPMPAPPRPGSAQPGARTMLHEPQRLTDSQHAVSVALGGGARRPVERPPDDFAPLGGSHEVRVRVLRPGFSPADDRPQCCFNQVIRMSATAAARAEGAIEILERYTAAVEPAPGEGP